MGASGEIRAPPQSRTPPPRAPSLYLGTAEGAIGVARSDWGEVVLA